MRFAELSGYLAIPAIVARRMPTVGCGVMRVGPEDGGRVPVSEVTDKPATPEMGPVAAFLPGSGVAQPGPTPSGKHLIGGR